MTAFDVPNWIVLTYLFVLGATIGSFLTVCVHRLPAAGGLRESLRAISRPPSSCPSCGTPIRLRDNVPIFGWLLLRGRCRACRAKISLRYPLFEIANGAMWVVLYLMEVPSDRFATIADSLLTTPYGPHHDSHPFLSDDWLVHLRYAFHLLLLELLLVASIIDADTKTIPKVVTDPWIVFGIVASFLGGLYLLPIATRPPGIDQDIALLWSVWFDAPPPSWLAAAFVGPPEPAWIGTAWGTFVHGGLVAIVGAIAGAAPILFMRVAGERIYGREAMGAGDVYLMALVGAFLGWQPALAAVVLSAFVAAAFFVVMAVVGLKAEIPYGPFLSAGAALVLFGWPWLWPRMEDFFGLGPLLVPVFAFLAVAFVVLAVLMRIVLHPILCLIPGYRDQWYAEAGDWTAADQNQFFAGSRIDGERDLTGRPDWTGEAVSSGFAGEHAWRDD